MCVSSSIRNPCLIKNSKNTNVNLYRADDKIAKDFNILPGAVLHLVLALRGGGGAGGGVAAFIDL